jgi:predicted ATPase
MALFITQLEIHGDRFPNVEAYPFNIPGLAGRQTLEFRTAVTFLVGENGSGKSTLLQALARRCDMPLWGQPQRARALGETPVSALCDHLEPSLASRSFSGAFFSAEGFRNWAEFLDDVVRRDPGQAEHQGGGELTARSHGQGILDYFRSRYRIPGLYFLDEPESALSPTSQIELLRLLVSYGQSGHAQFVIATHSPILMALPDSRLLHFEKDGIVERPYKTTGHFRIYQSFLADPGMHLAEFAAGSE